jgi:hypothetical protein
MPSSGMLRRVAPLRTDVSEECIASVIRMIRIGELGTTLAVTRNRSTHRASVARYTYLAATHNRSTHRASVARYAYLAATRVSETETSLTLLV